MEGVLSQEEIDALLGGGSSDAVEEEEEFNGPEFELTKEEIDAIGEVGNISLGSSSTALSTLLGKVVSINTPKVEALTFGGFQKKVSKKEKVLVQIEYTKGFNGLNILLIDKKDAVLIGDLMMGNDGSNPPEEFDDLYLSAVGEAMNQMMGTASTSLAGMFEKEIDINPPKVSLSSVEDLKEKTDFFINNPSFILVEFNLEIEGLINTSIYQIMTSQFVKKLTKEMYEMNAIDESPQPQPQPQPQIVPPQNNQWSQPQMQAQPQPQMQQYQQSQNIMGMGQQQQFNNVNVQPAQFSSFETGLNQALPSNIDMIMDIPLQVTVELGRTKMKIKEILDLGGGSIVELDRLAGEPVDIRVNGKMIAKGEVVVIDESFGVRITDIISKMERINNVQ